MNKILVTLVVQRCPLVLFFAVVLISARTVTAERITTI